MKYTPKVGDVRIVKLDAHNFAVERLEQPKPKKVKDGEEPKEQKPPAWVDVAYYGHKLEHAARYAMYHGIPVGDIVTEAVARECCERIIAATEAATK